MAVVNTRVLSTADRILQGSGKVLVDGLEVGGYEGGIQLDWAQQETFIKSDWQLGEIDSEVTGVTVQVQTTLEEATLENIAIAIGVHTSSVLSGTSSKVLGLIPPASMRQVALSFESMSGTNRDKIRIYSFPRCVRIGTAGLKHYRGLKLVVPVTFKVLMVNGTFGTVTDPTI